MIYLEPKLCTCGVDAKMLPLRCDGRYVLIQLGVKKDHHSLASRLYNSVNMTWDFTHFFFGRYIKMQVHTELVGPICPQVFLHDSLSQMPRIPSHEYPRVFKSTTLQSPSRETSKIANGPTLEHTVSASSSGWYIMKVLKVPQWRLKPGGGRTIL